MEEIKKFLLKIGAGDEVINALTADTLPEDFDMDKSVKEFKSKQGDLLKNDPDFINPIKKEIRGKELATAENKLKRVFGLTPEEMEDKKYEEILEIAKSKGSAKPADTSEEMERLQAELLTANNRVKEFEDVILPEAKAAAQNEINSYFKSNKIKDLVSSHSLIIDANAILPAVLSDLDANYNITLGDDKSLVVKTKDGTDPLNADKTAKVTLEQIIQSKLEAFNAIKKSNAGEPAGSTGSAPSAAPTTEPKNEFNLKGLDKAQANLDRAKNMRQM